MFTYCYFFKVCIYRRNNILLDRIFAVAVYRVRVIISKNPHLKFLDYLAFLTAKSAVKAVSQADIVMFVSLPTKRLISSRRDVQKKKSE